MSSVRSYALLSALVALTGCYSYRVAPLASIDPKHQFRVTSRDGHSVEVSDARVEADTLRGLAVRTRWFWDRRAIVVIAVADITKVEAQRVDVARTVAAGIVDLAIVAIPVSIAFVLTFAHWR